MSEFALVDFHRYRVSVEVAMPGEDWLVRLTEPPSGCSKCRGPLPDPPIYLNTEGEGGERAHSDLLCSWRCVLLLAASVAAVEDEQPGVDVVEIPDWRNDV